MASNDIHLELPDFAADSIDNHLRQLNASPPSSLLPAAEITVDERKGARESTEKGNEQSAETVIWNPLRTISGQDLPDNHASYVRQTELEQLGDAERIRRIIQATAEICTHSRGLHFARDFNIVPSIATAAERSGSSSTASFSNPPSAPVTGSPRLHRTPASRELRTLARLSAESASSQDTMSSCITPSEKLFQEKREPPKVSVATPGIESQAQHVVSIPVRIESNNPSATQGRKVDGNNCSARPESYVDNHRLSQIGVAVPMDEHTGYEPLKYLRGDPSDLDLDLARWTGKPTEDPPINKATATSSSQAFETGNQGREKTLPTSGTTSSSSRDTGKTVRVSGDIPLAPLASNSPGKFLNMSTADRSHDISSQSAFPPGSYGSVEHSHFADAPSKSHGRTLSTPVAGSSSRRVASVVKTTKTYGKAPSNPFTTSTSSSGAGEASNGVWEGPYDFNVLINTLETIVLYANARVNCFLRPILTRLEPEMVKELEDSHLYVKNKDVVSFQGRPPLGKAAQEAIRALVPPNRQVFVNLLAAILIAQDTLSILQEKAIRDANGPARFVERPATGRGKARALAFVGTLEKIDEGLGVVCLEAMKNIWGSCSTDTMEVLHGTALAAVRAALRC